MIPIFIKIGISWILIISKLILFVSFVLSPIIIVIVNYNIGSIRLNFLYLMINCLIINNY